MKGLSPTDYFEYRFTSKLRKCPQVYSKQLSETAAEYSALSQEELKLEKTPQTAQEALVLLLAYYHLLPVDADYLRSIILNKLTRKAKGFDYQGKWKLLREISDLPEDEPFDLWSIIHFLSEQYTLDDLFGNLVPAVNRVIKRMIGQRKFPVLIKRTSRVQYAQRKRGYSDHGSTTVPHKRGRNIPTSGPNPIKEEFVDRYPTTSPTTRMWIPKKPEGGS